MQNDSFTYLNPQTNVDARDHELWQTAKRRAAFKVSAASYVAVNCLLIGIWYLTSGSAGYFWPKWPLLDGALA